MAIEDAGAGRGLRVVDNKLFTVVGTQLYQITTAGVAIPCGKVPGVGRVSMSHNQRGIGNELAIDNGSARYVYNTQTLTMQKVTDTSFPGSIKAFFCDGYLGYIEPQGRSWGHSDLADALNYQAFDTYDAEGQPDRIVSGNVLMREVQIFGQESTELYINSPSGSGAAPFVRASNTVIPYGCSAKDSVVNIGGFTVFLDHNRCVRPLTPGASDPISTSVIESMLQGCTRQQIASACAFSVEAEGFQIYYLTVPGKFTFGFDFKNREWHRRASTGLDWWAVVDAVYWNGKWVVLDSRTAKLYTLDWEEYPFDGQQELVREWTTGVISADQNPIFLNEIELLFGCGGKAYEPIDFPAQPEGPTITGDAPDGTASAAYTYSYTGTPGDAPIARYKLFDAPSWLKISSDGTLTATLPVVVDQAYSFRVRVFDSNGLWSELADSIRVTTTGAPTIPTTVVSLFGISGGSAGTASQVTDNNFSEITNTEGPWSRILTVGQGNVTLPPPETRSFIYDAVSQGGNIFLDSGWHGLVSHQSAMTAALGLAGLSDYNETIAAATTVTFLGVTSYVWPSSPFILPDTFASYSGRLVMYQINGSQAKGVYLERPDLTSFPGATRVDDIPGGYIYDGVLHMCAWQQTE